jgi:carbohydrate-selective porin OprB
MLLLSVVSTSVADNAQQDAADGLSGIGESLAGSGIEVGIGVAGIYQQNVHGGLSTHRRAGRHSGSYDLEMTADLQKLLGFDEGSIYMLVEGGWPDEEGIEAGSVGSVFGVNADAIGNDAMLVKELYCRYPLLGDNSALMIGKIDFTGVFDASAYADDETSQFLNGAFVDNPTIPFPEYSLGAVLSCNPTESWYIMAGAADAQADGRETGFRTTFGGEDYFLYILETGITPELDLAGRVLQGAYRAGLWNDPQPKGHSDATKKYRDDVGFYISCDQMLTKENAEPQDNQGLGTFFRYGYANSRKNDIYCFWSVGFQYQGLVEGRDEDVLGIGFAQGIFSNKASATYTEDCENALELYYNALVRRQVSISPSIQYITNPGGDNVVSDAVVLGLRVKIMF